MVGAEDSTFQMSIVEIFILILFIVVAFASTAFEDSPEEESPVEETVDIDSLTTVIEDLRETLNEIDFERDSLKKELYGIVDSASIENEIGTGRGSCWKEGEQTVSVMKVVMYDQTFRLSSSWPPEFEQEATKILNQELHNKLSSGKAIELSQKSFIQQLQSVRSASDNSSPPCLFISNIVDSTTSKESYKNQKKTIESIFVTKEISGANED